ncbi:unnamed protein product [Auanema sp. JU1783]|nr:unnamed protein product [Auanema sp. JU1783]
MTAPTISEADQALIAKLRQLLEKELELVPEYSDDFSLMRWLIGWDRKINVIVPKLRFSLKAIHALGLDSEDLTTFDKIQDKCDSYSVPLQSLPGSVVGMDKEGNVLSIQMVGRLDAVGLMQCARNSDLYKMRIAESEGVMQIIRAEEKKCGHPLGTSVIFDLEGISMSQFEMNAVKVVTTMLGQLQELFPDVVRKIFVINAPSFIQFIWTLVLPCLAKQTQQKIKVLGSDWKEVLRESLGEEVLFAHWGGTREADSEFGNVRLGGKVPQELRYDPSADPPVESLEKHVVSARSTSFIPIKLDNYQKGRKLTWWWKLDGHDVNFAVYRSSEGNEKVAEHVDDYMLEPKFRLQTEFVPEQGEVCAEEPGIYKFVFDNTHSTLRSKTIRYSIKTL